MPKPLNVLILEDNPADAELLLIELRRAGYDPTSQIVDNEKDFSAHLKPELDLILSDYSLPQFNGLQALQLRNASGYDIPFIIVSGEISEKLAVECMREGADDYLMKDRMGRLGSAVTNAVKKKELRDEKQQAQQKIEMLLNLSRQAGAETSLNDLLFFIAGQIVEVIPSVEAASIFLYDKEREVLKVQAWAGFTDSEIEGLEFSVDSKHVGKTFRTRKPALVNNLSERPDLKLVDRPSLSKVKSMIAVPLVYKKRVVGIISADNLTRTDAFSQKNLDFLESIGNQLSGVIENARLLDQVRESHKQLSHSEKRLLKAQQVGRLGFVELDPKTNQSILSDEVYVIHGFDPREGLLTHELIMKAIHPDDREFVQKSIDSLIQKGEIIDIDHRIVLPDGEVRWVNKQAEIIFDEDDSPGAILGTMLDITERKQTLEKLRQRTEDMSVVHAINATANRGEELQEILDVFSEKTKGIFSGFGATVYLLSKDKKKLVMQESYLPPTIEK